MKLCYEWINLSLQGIDYYNTYYKLPLLLCVTLTGIGWIILLIFETNSIKKCRKLNKLHKLAVNITFLIIFMSAYFFIYGKFLYNVLYYLYLYFDK